MRDLYADLGVPPAATFAEIRGAWRKATFEHHPDRPGGDEEAFKAATAAYEILGDPVTRKSYDDMRSAAPGSAGFKRFAADLAGKLFVRLWTDLCGELPELAQASAAFQSRDWFTFAQAAFGIGKRIKGQGA